MRAFHEHLEWPSEVSAQHLMYDDNDDIYENDNNDDNDDDNVGYV